MKSAHESFMLQFQPKKMDQVGQTISGRCMLTQNKTKPSLGLVNKTTVKIKLIKAEKNYATPKYLTGKRNWSSDKWSNDHVVKWTTVRLHVNSNSCPFGQLSIRPQVGRPFVVDTSLTYAHSGYVDKILNKSNLLYCNKSKPIRNKV